MPMFLLIFFSLYGAMQCYVFWKVAAALPPRLAVRAALGGLLVLMTVAPVAVHLLDRWGHERAGQALGRAAYIWMALVFWFCVLGLLADGWRLGVRAVALAIPGARAALPPPRTVLGGIAVILAVALCRGLAEAGNIQTRRITLRVPGGRAGARKLTIAQISDLHLGVHTGPWRLAKALRLVRQADPDVLVCTGDLVDSPLPESRPLAELLAEVQPPLGKYAVLGNHEFYVGVEESLAFHRAAGFRVLRGESVTLAGALRIAGVDYGAGRWTGQACFTDEAAALPARKDGLATILLKHEPRVSGSSVGRFDLQLSGHTHGGQVFPFHLVTRLVYGVCCGWHDLPGGATLYVNRGAGTWGPPIRLLAQPEVTLITVEPG